MMYATVGLFFAGIFILFAALMVMSHTLKMCTKVLDTMKDLLTLIDNGYLSGSNRP